MVSKSKTGGAAPYGYQRTRVGFKPHPDESPIRKLIFELFLKHKKKLTVANILNQKGYRTRTGAQFSDSSISRFLSDPIVKGHHKSSYRKPTDGKQYRQLKDTADWRYPPIEPLIDETTWNQVDDILQSQKAKPATKKRAGIFAGYLTCMCGTSMHHPHGRKHYFCSGCDNRIDAEVIEAIFSEQLKDFKLDPVELMAARSDEKAVKNNSSRIEILRKDKHATEREMEKLYDLYMSSAITKDRFSAKNAGLEERQTSLSTEMENLISNETKNPDGAKSDFPENLGIAWTAMSMSSKRELVELITRNIAVGISSIKVTFALSPSSF